MNKTDIDWADRSWNPITGCLHNCEYCYARGIANRFGVKPTIQKAMVLNIPHEDVNGKIVPFPNGFNPTLHRYRLDEPQKIKKPQTIFVGNMADMFGDWVPDEWIAEVFKACEAAPWHRYLFLTKNPKRYIDVKHKLPSGNNYWYGTTATTSTMSIFWSEQHNIFVSIEPLQEQANIGKMFLGRKSDPSMIIVGAETGNRKSKIIPKREWIETIVNACREASVPIFLKNNLKEIWGEPLIQEFPWEEK